MNLKISSYGVKNGAGNPAIWCTDLPNPFHKSGMRKLTGIDPQVQKYVTSNDRATHLLKVAGSNLLAEGEVTFACYGGKHRSVAMAEVLAAHMRTLGHTVTVSHRDV